MKQILFHYTPEPFIHIVERYFLRKNKISFLSHWEVRDPAKDYSYRKNIKITGINRLGGKCINCGIDDPRILTINHLNGHKKLAIDRRGDNYWLDFHMDRIKRDEIDLRCYNCNILYEFERGIRKDYYEIERLA